jgi:acetyl-CoA synthetase
MGNLIHAHFTLHAGCAPSPELAGELAVHVGKEIGPIARPVKVEFVDVLPRTRSGKIMRRVLKARP